MAQASANRVALYAAIGPELTHYDVDVEGAALSRRGTITLPANVHYAWPHRSGQYLYVASSDSASALSRNDPPETGGITATSSPSASSCSRRTYSLFTA